MWKMAVPAAQRVELEGKIRAFLYEAHREGGYGQEDAKIKKKKDGSETIVYRRGPWKLHDNFFGGEPYGGREVVSFNGRPVFIMSYYGAVSEEPKGVKDIYSALRRALRNVDPKEPFRGADRQRFRMNGRDYWYTTNFRGNVRRLHGGEVLWQDHDVVYQAWFLGGLVDLRKG